jgi:hypothetical protein
MAHVSDEQVPRPLNDIGSLTNVLFALTNKISKLKTKKVTA